MMIPCDLLMPHRDIDRTQPDPLSWEWGNAIVDGVAWPLDAVKDPIWAHLAERARS